jgi:hypothetical protein
MTVAIPDTILNNPGRSPTRIGNSSAASPRARKPCNPAWLRRRPSWRNHQRPSRSAPPHNRHPPRPKTSAHQPRNSPAPRTGWHNSYPLSPRILLSTARGHRWRPRTPGNHTPQREPASSATQLGFRLSHRPGHARRATTSQPRLRPAAHGCFSPRAPQADRRPGDPDRGQHPLSRAPTVPAVWVSPAHRRPQGRRCSERSAGGRHPSRQSQGTRPRA